MKKKLISLAVSLTILGVVYWHVDLRAIVTVLGQSDPLLTTVGLGMVIPITLLTAWRLSLLVPSGEKIPFAESLRLILSAAVLNMVLPSKMGDLAKSVFMTQHHGLSGSLALSLVVFEKSCDMLALLAWCVFGLVFYAGNNLFVWLTALLVGGGLVFGIAMLLSMRFAKLFFSLLEHLLPEKMGSKVISLRDSWAEMNHYIWREQRRFLWVFGFSIFLWFLHLSQIWLFILALQAQVPFMVTLALTPLAILFGLMPLTFAGIGTRDAAFIALFAPYFNPATGAALGIFGTLRYIMPALAGLPFFGHYVTELKIRNSK
jgi:uncharacterized protein (TIRG00374 family)